MISVPVGIGGEILAPLFCIAIFLIFYYQFFVLRNLPPLWFFAGGVGIFIGWLLLTYQHYLIAHPFSNENVYTIRNPKNWSNIHWQILLNNFFQRVQNSKVYLPLLYIFSSSLKRRAFSEGQIFSKGDVYRNILLSTGLIGLFISSLAGIPDRSYVTFTIFLAVVASIDFWKEINSEKTSEGLPDVWFLSLLFLFFLKLSPWEPYIRTILSTGFIGYLGMILFKNSGGLLSTIRRCLIPAFGIIVIYNLIAYGTFYYTYSGYFKEIEQQKSRENERILISSPSIYDWYGIISVYHFTRNSTVVLDPMARYYGVKSIDFVDPITYKSHRILD